MVNGLNQTSRAKIAQDFLSGAEAIEKLKLQTSTSTPTPPPTFTTFAGKSNAEFVRQAYLLILKREPTTSDVVYWTNSVNQNSRIAVLNWMFMSAESHQKNGLASNEGFIEGLYKVFLLRQSDSSGFAFWLSVLQTSSREYTTNEFLNNSNVKTRLGL